MSNLPLDPLDSEINSLSKTVEIQEITPWEICAKAVGGLMITVFAGLALVTILQATGALSLPHSMEWIILAAEGSWPQLLGVVATTVGGCAIGILAIVYGTPKKPQQISLDDNEAPASSSNKKPQYLSFKEYLEAEMEPGSYWFDPNYDNADEVNYCAKDGSNFISDWLTLDEINQRIEDKTKHEAYYLIDQEYVQGLWQDGLPNSMDTSNFSADWQEDMSVNTYFKHTLAPEQDTFIFKKADNTFRYIKPLNSRQAYNVDRGYLSLNFRTNSFVFV
jgi:hypothetical protein